MLKVPGDLTFLCGRNCTKCQTTLSWNDPDKMMDPWVSCNNKVGQPGQELFVYLFILYLFLAFHSVRVLKKQNKHLKLQTDMFSQIAHSWMASFAPYDLTFQSSLILLPLHLFLFGQNIKLISPLHSFFIYRHKKWTIVFVLIFCFCFLLLHRTCTRVMIK